MLQDFFESNSISYEVFELFEDFCGEKQKKPALRATFRQMKEDYADEPGEYIIVLMSVYYCGLKKSIEDLKFKKELEALTEEQIYACFGEDDGKTVMDVLDELLKMPPDPPVRKKIDYSNPGSKNWKVGDLYAYRLRGEEVEKAGLEGKYAIVYCVGIEKDTSRRNNIDTYVLLCEESDLKKDARVLLKDSFLVASYAHDRRYLYLLVSSHHEYPTEELIYLGNSMEFEYPPKDKVFVGQYRIFIPRLLWGRFSDHITSNYLSTLEYLGNE